MSVASSVRAEEWEAAAIAHAGVSLTEAPLPAPYRAALTQALALPGNILSPAPNLRWARLVWTCCLASGGRDEQVAVPAAAAEIFMVALDLLDDMEDGEENDVTRELGVARALNASTGLLLLAQRMLRQEPDGAALAGILLDAGLRACGGQDADLTAPAGDSPSLDAALAIAADKSGSLAGALCRIGVAAAGADSEVQERYACFGRSLGIAAQLANDIRAVAPGAIGKTDVLLRRPTLPLLYPSQSAPMRGAERGSRDPWDGGGAHFAWVVAETHRRHALDLVPALSDLPAHQAGLVDLLHVL